MIDMKKEALKKTVYLCGFMGSGKSTAGMILSKNLSLPRVDTDFIISKKENMPITEIFAKKGEEYFRKKETRLLFRLSHQSSRIVSLGGGTVLREKNVRICKKKGFILFLNVPFETVYERIRRNNKRPIANSKTKEELEELYNARLISYREVADIEIIGEGSAEQTAEKIYEALKEKGIIK